MKTRCPGSVNFSRFFPGRDRPTLKRSVEANEYAASTKLAVLGVLLFSVFTLGEPVHADDECRGHSCNDSGGDIDIDITGGPVDVTGGATNVETNVAGSSYSSRALALGNGLGDVDINDCLGSEQFGTPLYSRQWLELNKWCAAEVFDAKGLNLMAGKLRCEIKEIRALFAKSAAGDAECVEANTVVGQPAAREIAPVVASLSARQDEHDEEEERHESELAAIMQRQTELEQRLQTEAANRRAASARYAREQQQLANEQAAETESFLQQYKEIAQQIEEPPANE